MYKTGDVHPIHNLCAFVEYDEEIGEIWTSIASDPEAPFRLALENKQLRNSGKRIQTCTFGTADLCHSNQHPVLPIQPLPDKS